MDSEQKRQPGRSNNVDKAVLRTAEVPASCPWVIFSVSLLDDSTVCQCDTLPE